MMIGTMVLLCLVGANLAEDLHQQMTPEERDNIFQTTSSDDGNLIYKIVKIKKK